jgi:hypothetical protein
VDAALVVAHRILPAPWWDLDGERNVPSLWAGAQLASLAVAALVVHSRERRRFPALVPPAGLWMVAGAVFFWLALDETLAIHEHVLRDEVRDLFGAASVWRALLPWQVVFGPLLLATAAALGALFLARFAGRPYLLGPAVGGLACWAGALALEALVKPVFSPRGWHHREVMAEESLELFGAAFLLLALVRWADELAGGVPVAAPIALQRRRAVLGVTVWLAAAAALAAGVAGAFVLNAGPLHRYNAQDLARRRQWAGAVVAFDAALAHSPDDVRSLRGKAQALYRLGRRSEAKTCYRRAAHLARGEKERPSRAALSAGAAADRGSHP